MKPQIYKVGTTWILWVPGVRVYRFNTWENAIRYALDQGAKQPAQLSRGATAS